MQIKKLEIAPKSSYEESSPLQGFVKLSGPTGTQELVLSSKAMSEIFKIVKAEIVETARKNASMVPAAADEAAHGVLLAQASTVDLLS